MISTYLKQQLLTLARHLNPVARGGFLRSVAKRLDGLALAYPRTFVYAAAGYCVGRLVEALVGLPAGLPALVAGGLAGLHRDINADIAEEEIRRVVAEEFKFYAGLR